MEWDRPDRLAEMLTEAGASPAVLHGGEGQALLCLDYGARALALYIDAQSPSVFWVHPALREAAAAREAMARRKWINLGGDRTWLAPEIDVNYGPPEDVSGKYSVPEALDPGHWQLEGQGDTVWMQTQMSVPVRRRGFSALVAIRRAVRLIANPLRGEPGTQDLLVQTSYAGYEQETELELIACADPQARLGIWNLIVLPAGGMMLVPTLGIATTRDFIGRGSPDRVAVTPGAVRIVADGRHQHKLGVRAAALTGRAGYVREESSGCWTLVLRNFCVNPSGEYIDVAVGGEQDHGYAFQAYNDDGALGDFCEMEYHAPTGSGMAGPGGGRHIDRECSQVWAYRGGREQIADVAARLLGPNVW